MHRALDCGGSTRVFELCQHSTSMTSRSLRLTHLRPWSLQWLPQHRAARADTEQPSERAYHRLNIALLGQINSIVYSQYPRLRGAFTQSRESHI